jgi:hypothetical protein
MPLKFAVKYAPPSIGLVYSFESNPKKKYCHDIPLIVDEESNVDRVVDKLYEQEKAYVNNIRKEQIKKLVYQVVEHL